MGRDDNLLAAFSLCVCVCVCMWGGCLLFFCFHWFLACYLAPLEEKCSGNRSQGRGGATTCISTLRWKEEPLIWVRKPPSDFKPVHSLGTLKGAGPLSQTWGVKGNRCPINRVQYPHQDWDTVELRGSSSMRSMQGWRSWGSPAQTPAFLLQIQGAKLPAQEGTITPRASKFCIPRASFSAGSRASCCQLRLQTRAKCLEDRELFQTRLQLSSPGRLTSTHGRGVTHRRWSWGRNRGTDHESGPSESWCLPSRDVWPWTFYWLSHSTSFGEKRNTDSPYLTAPCEGFTC